MSGRVSKALAMFLVMFLVLLGGIFLVFLLEEVLPQGIEGVILGLMGLGGMSWALFGGPIGKAIAGMLESSGSKEGDAVLGSRVADLEDRLQELALETQRVGELEDRLDFAERLLARHSESGDRGQP